MRHLPFCNKVSVNITSFHLHHVTWLFLVPTYVEPNWNDGYPLKYCPKPWNFLFPFSDHMKSLKDELGKKRDKDKSLEHEVRINLRE